MKAAKATVLLLAVVVAAAAALSPPDAVDHQPAAAGGIASTLRGGGHHNHGDGRHHSSDDQTTLLTKLAQCATTCGANVANCIMIKCYEPLARGKGNPVSTPLCLIGCTTDVMSCASSCPNNIVV